MADTLQTTQANSQAIADKTNSILNAGGSVDLSKVTSADQVTAVPSPTSTITSSSLKPSSPINLPPVPTAPNYSGITAGAIAGATTPAPNTTPTATPNNTTSTGGAPAPITPPTLSDRFQGYLSKLGLSTPTAPTSEVDSYNKLASDNDLAGKQKVVNDLTASINTIKAQGDAAKLSLVGNNTGVPLAIIGGQQAEIDRETAIKTLPLTAQLNAAQGNLTTATNNINTVLKLMSDDAAAKYKYQSDQIAQAMSFATDDQKTALQDKQNELDKDKQKQADFQATKQKYIDAALSNQDFKTAAALSSTTSTEQLQATAKNMTGNALDNQLKTLQIKQLQANISKTYQDIANTKIATGNAAADNWANLIKNGQAKLSDVPAALKTAVATAMNNAGINSDSTNALVLQTNDAINQLTKTPGKSAAIGTNIPSPWSIITDPIDSFGFKGMPGSKSAGYLAQLDQVKGLLTVANLGLLKGVGRITQAEFNTLNGALTTLNKNLPEKQYDAELAKIQKVFNDKATALNGGEVPGTGLSNYKGVTLPGTKTSGSTYNGVKLPN